MRLLVTSRELLRISGERGHPVPPLDLDAGVALFIARATAAAARTSSLDDESAAAVRQICERLFGLPLAIELAAARVRLLSPALILERLAASLDLGGGSRDLPERQRTLRGAIAWSHELLSASRAPPVPPARRVRRRLDRRAGAARRRPRRRARQSTSSTASSRWPTRAWCAIDRRPGAGGREPRFDLHPLLREYAARAARGVGRAGRGRAAARRACAEIAALADGPRSWAADAPAGSRLDVEQHNVRAAVDWARRTGSQGPGCGSWAPIWRWFHQRGRLREGTRRSSDR